MLSQLASSSVLGDFFPKKGHPGNTSKTMNVLRSTSSLAVIMIGCLIGIFLLQIKRRKKNTTPKKKIIRRSKLKDVTLTSRYNNISENSVPDSEFTQDLSIPSEETIEEQPVDSINSIYMGEKLPVVKMHEAINIRILSSTTFADINAKPREEILEGEAVNSNFLVYNNEKSPVGKMNEASDTLVMPDVTKSMNDDDSLPVAEKTTATAKTVLSATAATFIPTFSRPTTKGKIIVESSSVENNASSVVEGPSLYENSVMSTMKDITNRSTCYSRDSTSLSSQSFVTTTLSSNSTTMNLSDGSLEKCIKHSNEQYQQSDRREKQQNTTGKSERQGDPKIWTYPSEISADDQKNSWEDRDSDRLRYHRNEVSSYISHHRQSYIDDSSGFHHPTTNQQMNHTSPPPPPKTTRRHAKNSKERRGNTRPNNKKNQNYDHRHRRPKANKDNGNKRAQSHYERVHRKSDSHATPTIVKSESFFSSSPTVFFRRSHPQNLSSTLVPKSPNVLNRATDGSSIHHISSYFCSSLETGSKKWEKEELCSLLDRIGLVGDFAVPLVSAIADVDALECLSDMQLHSYGLSSDQQAYLSILLAERRKHKQVDPGIRVESPPTLFEVSPQNKSSTSSPLLPCSTSSVLETLLFKQHPWACRVDDCDHLEQINGSDTDEEESRIEADLQELGGQMIASILDS